MCALLNPNLTVMQLSLYLGNLTKGHDVLDFCLIVAQSHKLTKIVRVSACAQKAKLAAGDLR